MRQATSRVTANCRRRNHSLYMCLLFWGLVSAPVSAQVANGAASGLDSELRAAVVVGVLRYAHWTQVFSPDNDNPELTICSWGNAPSMMELENNGQSIRIRDQAILLHRATAEQDLRNCPVVIVGHQAKVGVSTTLNGRALVICDTCDRDQVEAIVSLVRVNDRIDFEIDLNRARAAGISFSSDLLNLARHVEGL